MIIGLGSDLCDIKRIEQTLARHGERFLQRIYTPLEIEKARRAKTTGGMAASCAKRFAAKEACAKALGTGLRHGVFWRDMGVINLRSGQPTLQLTNGALARLEQLTPKGLSVKIDLTMTDEYPLALAVVIISVTSEDVTASR